MAQDHSDLQAAADDARRAAAKAREADRELQRKLAIFEDQLERDGIELVRTGPTTTAPVGGEGDAQ